MKRLKYLVAVLLATVITTAQAQNDPKAGEILDAMSEKYKAVPAFRASFTYTLESPGSNLKENYSGDITVKNGKFHLKMGEQEVINNGTTVWTYLKESNEVNISDYQPEEDAITPTNIYTIHKKGYKYTYVEQKKEGGQTYDVVDLTPENKNAQIYKIRLVVNRKDRSVRSFKTFEKNGNRQNYLITKFAPAEVDDKLFVFDQSKYKNVEVVDLR
jgi:chaperone LolA